MENDADDHKGVHPQAAKGPNKVTRCLEVGALVAVIGIGAVLAMTILNESRFDCAKEQAQAESCFPRCWEEETSEPLHLCGTSIRRACISGCAPRIEVCEECGLPGDGLIGEMCRFRKAEEEYRQRG